MLSDTAEALEEAQAAEDLARVAPISERQTLAIAQAYWLQAEALNRLNRPADAEPLIQRALGLIGEERINSKLGADLLLAQGRVSRRLTDDERALKSFHRAHDIFASLGEARYQALALQAIGSVYRDARSYERVLEYYERAASVYPDDASLQLPSLNNRANAHRSLGNFDESVELLDQALEVAGEMDSPLLLARIMSNKASSLVDAGQFDFASEVIEEAMVQLELSGSKKWKPMLQGVQAQILAGQGDQRGAARLLESVFAKQELDQTTTPFKAFHELAYNVYKSEGRTKLALAHLEAFKRLDDSGRDIAANANNVLIAAEFDSAALKLEISELEGTQLRNEIALQKSQARQRLIAFSSIGAGVIVLTGALAFGLIVTHRNQKRVKNANQELAKANTDLDRANRAKTEFLAATSHEIRTPLNGVLGLAQVMLADDSLSPEVREHAQQIRGAGDTLLAVVNDILDVATIESGRFETSEAVTNVPKLAGEVVGIFTDQAKSKGLRLTVDAGDCPEAIVSDGMRLRQVMFNLVSNAIKFTEQGGVHLALSVQSTNQGESLSIKVSDTGIGIPESQLNSIFDTFHQVDGGRTRKFGGTGLGLSICQHIARALGGEIAVTSRLGEGSRFNILIPLKRLTTEEKSERRADLVRNISSIADLDVLVVEDNLLNRTVIRALIDKHVRSVTLTEDGVQCLAAMKEKHFDLILMDKQMPNMDGLTATKTIRSMTNGDEFTYIIAVTADAYDGAREELIAAGVDDYLSKPVSAEGLMEAIELAVTKGVTHQSSDTPPADDSTDKVA